MLDSPQEHFNAEAIPKAPRRPGNAAAAPCSLLEMQLERRAREPWRPAREERRYRKLSFIEAAGDVAVWFDRVCRKHSHAQLETEIPLFSNSAWHAESWLCGTTQSSVLKR
ncbi:hypothetical protein B296_00001694 [Ensete ventricosum]|uniref:Uncharacterized protein n=1 Tax=Ensete ventricosum TaxID=4639 RepID=A0A426ZWA5_ENSVE|nr:hypothetical protein B296_00001694 [Ensete ventricosum]